MFFRKNVAYCLFRNKARTFLLMIVSVLLIATMAFYIGNIQSTQSALGNLVENIPVTVRIVSRDGSRQAGLNIDTEHYEAISASGVHNILSTGVIVGAMSEQARAENPFIGGDTTIVGGNCIEALAISEQSFTYAPGFDSSIFAGSENHCIVDAAFAERNHILVGDTVTLPTYRTFWKNKGVTFQKVGDLSLCIVGTCNAADAVGDPVSFYVPINWLREQVEKAGTEFYYSYFSAKMDDPMNLNIYKENLEPMGFMEPYEGAEDQFAGDAVSIEDELFIKTAGKLRQNLRTFQRFLLPFFALMIGLITMSIFLILRSARRDMAIASSLGVSRKKIVLIYFTSVFLADLFGCVLAFPVLIMMTEIPLAAILAICGLFLLCACLGTIFALLLLLRFDALTLLTKVD